MIERLPAPLVEDIARDRVLPIIGAGLSKNAELPAGLSMPDWRELGDALANDLTGYDADGDAVDAISEYEREYDRPRLVQTLRQLLHVDVARAGDVHRAFARIPFDVVCTTNADLLLEDAYTQVGRKHRVIVEEQQLSLGLDQGATTILKLHGDVNHPQQLIFTEGDFDSFATRNPLFVTFLSSLLITRTGLFIGYSLSDPDLRQILAAIKDRLGSMHRKPYALVYDASSTHVRRFLRRDVNVIDIH